MNSTNREHDYIFNEKFCITEIHTAITELKLRKAPGHDMLQNEHLKHSGNTIEKIILLLFNSILNTSYIPESWRIGIIIPIYKGSPKPKDDPESYRAVSLLPILYKLYEKIVLNRINKWIKLESINFPNHQQQGFQKRTRLYDCII